MSNLSDIAPGSNAYAVTKSDTAAVAGPSTDNIPRALYIGGAGDVAVKFYGNDTAVTFAGVAAGTVLPIRPVRVMSTNTTATNIVAIY